MIVSVAVRKRSERGLASLARRLFQGLRASRSATSRAEASESERRSRERYRRITVGASVAISSRAAAILSALVSVPLVLHSYGSDRFAIWATLNSFILLLAFSDLGLSHGLVNLLGETRSRRDRRRSLRYVSSAFGLIGGIVICVSAGFAVAYPLIDWAAVFQVTSSSAVHQAAPAAFIFAVCFLLNMVLGVAHNVRIAYQESAAAYGWLTLGSVLGVVALGVVVAAGGSFPLAVAATCGGPVLASFLSSFTLFAGRRPWLRPELTSVKWVATRRLLRTGGMFFVVQASTAIAYQSDAIIIAQVRGAEAVTKYMIPLRLFAFLPTTLLFAVIPFWPAFRSAIVTGDIRWAAQGLRRCILIGLVVIVPLSCLLAAFASPLLSLWSGRVQAPGLGLLGGLVVWVILSAVVTPLWTFLTGAGALRPLALMAVTMMVVNVGLSIALTHSIGVQGAIYGTDISQLVFLVVPGGYYAHRMIRRLSSGEARASESVVTRASGAL